MRRLGERKVRSCSAKEKKAKYCRNCSGALWHRLTRVRCWATAARKQAAGSLSVLSTAISRIVLAYRRHLEPREGQIALTRKNRERHQPRRCAFGRWC